MVHTILQWLGIYVFGRQLGCTEIGALEFRQITQILQRALISTQKFAFILARIAVFLTASNLSGNQMSRFFTSSALSSMNFRRASTSSPISVVKIASVSAMSSSLTESSVRRSGIHRRFPKLRRGHFAQTLVALHLVLLLALFDDVSRTPRVRSASPPARAECARRCRRLWLRAPLRRCRRAAAPSAVELFASSARLLHGRFGRILDEERRFELLLDLRVLRHHLPELRSSMPASSRCSARRPANR